MRNLEDRERERIMSLSVCQWIESHPYPPSPPPMLFASCCARNTYVGTCTARPNYPPPPGVAISRSPEYASVRLRQSRRI